MELPSKLLEQIAYNTHSRIEEHMLVVMGKSTHEEHLLQPLQTNNKQLKVAVTFLTGYIGIFNFTNLKNKFHFTTSISDIEPSFIIIPPAAYELETLDDEIKRICFFDGRFSKSNYPFKIKPNFSLWIVLLKLMLE